EPEKAESVGIVKIAEEIEKIVLSLDTVKLIFQDRYGRKVEAVVFDATTGEWTIDFLMPKELPEDPPGE
ncbi:unnamed protein product, partial [marine sediment metagenome]